MSRASASAAFAVAAGRPADIAASVFLGGDPRGGPRLLVAIEPMDTGPRARELSVLALSTIRDRFLAQPGVPLADRLGDAVAAANTVLFHENRAAVGRWERPVLAGVTAIALAGREMVTAQLPPSQLIAVQDRRLYAVPALASWGAREEGAADGDDVAQPLGAGQATSPTILRTQTAPGDLVVLCHSAIARAAARFPSSGALVASALAGGDPDAGLDALTEIVVERGLDDAFAVVYRIDGRRALGFGGPARFASNGRNSEASEGAAAARPLDVARFFTVAPPEPASHIPARQRSIHSARSAALPPQRTASAIAAVGGAMALDADADPFESLRLGIVGLVESFRIAPGLPHHGHRMPQRTVPGAGSISRYVGGAGWASPAARAALPRGVALRIPGRLLVLLLLLALLVAGAALAVGIQQARQAQAAAALAAADRAVNDLSADPVAPMLAIADGEAALEAASAAGADPELVAARQGAFDAARDQALGVERLSNMARLGGLPDGVDAENARLVTLGQRVFLAGGGFYEIDARRGFLVELLAPGQTVDGVAIGRIVDATVDETGVLLSDGAALYQQDADGAWRRVPLSEPRPAGGPTDGPTASFNRMLYAIAPGGSIVKYENDGRGLTPWMWASAAEYPDLADARDLAVDERVHVLLADGRVVSFYRGVLESASAVPVAPEFAAQGFFASAPGSRALYLVDTTARVGSTVGRLIRYDGGGRTQQFLAPIASPNSAEGALAARALAESRSVAVVEGAASVYLLAGGEIWRATLPPIVN